MSSAFSLRAARVAERQSRLAQRREATAQRVANRIDAAAKRLEAATIRREDLAHRRAKVLAQRAHVAAAREARAQTIEAMTPLVPQKSWLARSRAWISILLLLPVATLVVLSPPKFLVASNLAFLCTAAGYALFTLGVAWRWWATLYIGGVKDREVITKGPYSISRNPLYFGTLLITFSLACFMQSLSLAAMMVVVGILYVKVTVANEETRLAAQMGQSYLDYCARVPRFWPRWSLYEPGESLLVEINGIQAEALRALQYAFLPLVCHGMLLLRAAEWWPKSLWLP